MAEPSADRAGAAATWLVRLLLLAFAGSLGWAIVTLPAANGLGDEVAAAMPRSGVAHEVTAVLMNFRAYDTLLEVTVLLLALIGTRTLGGAAASGRDPGPVLRALAMLMIPFLILFSGYLLWAGGHEPGGAFQAGTLLAAAGVLAALAGYPWIVTMPDWRLRALVAMGPVLFTAAGAGVMLSGRQFLELPPEIAGTIILLIEAAAMVSIGVTLLAALHGATAGAGGERE